MNRSRILTFMFSMLVTAVMSAQAPMDTIYVSHLYTSHIVFSTDITYADVSNPTDIAVKLIEQNKNMMALKARNPFGTTASVTALESNGIIHTYIIAYREKPAQLVMDVREDDAQPEYRMKGSAGKDDGAAAGTETSSSPVKEDVRPARGGRSRAPAMEGNVSNLRKQDAPMLKDVIEYPAKLKHIYDRFQKVEVSCENIFAYSDITYITVRLTNRSGVSFETRDAMFVIEDSNRSKRKVKPEPVSLMPRNRFGTLTAAPGETVKAAYTFEKVTLGDDQIIAVYIYEKGGQRNLLLKLTSEDVNLAGVPEA